MDHQFVLHRVAAWALADPSIRALVLTGSLARDIDDVDEFSDLDVELYTTNPAALLDEEAWYQQFGEVLVVEALENPGWHPTRLVYYADGKIDFMVAPIQVLAKGVVYDRPFRVVVDKDGVAGAFRGNHTGSGRPPTSDEFLQCVHWFYAAIIMWAKYLARDDPWAAKIRDWDSKIQLLRMLEWDHKVRRGWDYDTWYGGTHLRAWMDSDRVIEVAPCWSDLSPGDSIRAVRASLALFDELSRHTACSLDLVPFDAKSIWERVEYLLTKAQVSL